MNNFVELWVYFSATPLFGLTVALAVYVLGNAVCVTLAKVPWANAVYVRLTKVPWAIPVLLTVLTLPSALWLVWIFGFRIFIVMVVSGLTCFLVTVLAFKLFFRSRITVSTATEEPLAQHPKNSTNE